ncbi:transcriptional regulator PpsR [Roseivivax marinus]|uniref:transcriptional regulator PpsR n=1 Tax=Roseivivax marinus TaxID=1379903 RepID=UPI001F037F52|nr:transcriptional regulator PpsR [Roseivivax marinus]UMA64322.1 transcriptional regulator PpsR [Roseivivax marinus]
MTGSEHRIPSLAARESADSSETTDLERIVAAASDLTLVLDASGVVTRVIVGGALSADAGVAGWEGRPIEETLVPEGRTKLIAAREALEAGRPLPSGLELTHVLGDGVERPMRYTMIPYGAGAMLLGRDQAGLAEQQRQLVDAQLTLERTYEAQREFDTRYRMLLRAVNDAVAFVSAGDGTIGDLNEPAAALLGGTREGLMGTRLAEALGDTAPDGLMDEIDRAATRDAREPVVAAADASGRGIAIAPQLFRAAGKRSYLCRLSDPDAEAGGAPGISADVSLLFERSTDAVVFATLSGKIATANEAFLDLVGAARLADLRGQNLAGFLGRGRVDLNVVAENARRAGTMRLYATRMVSELGAETPVEMSVTYLNDRTDPLLGLVIRDAARSEAVRAGPAPAAMESASSVMELVGSATLREIVAETTDVVEKMCIETAVQLTRNNRVAAAEMLGLSRQSLYVKLRKYGLLNYDPNET